MSTMVTGNFPRALKEGIDKWWEVGMKEWAPLYPLVFKPETSNDAYEINVQYTDLGYASAKTEAAPTQYDSMEQGYKALFTNVLFSKGLVVSHELVADAKYGIIQKRVQKLGRALRQTKEQVAFNILNNAFTNTAVDGSTLCATSHAHFSGGTWANRPSSDVDLSESALEDASIEVQNWTTDRGLPAAYRLKNLVISPANSFEAGRILTSVLRSSTADNDANILRSEKIIQHVVNTPYMAVDTDAWFVTTDADDGLCLYDREPITFVEEPSSESLVLKHIAYCRFSAGYTDAHGVYGSTGV